jgi:hypothetical protein
MRLSQEFLAAIDEWRRKQPDIPNRAESIRRLVLKGIKADETPVLRPQARKSGVSRPGDAAKRHEEPGREPDDEGKSPKK